MKRRVLIVAEAVTLAHVGRPLALAAILERLGHEAIIACSPSAKRWIEAEGRGFIPIESISHEQFLRALRLGKPVFDAPALERHVEADLALIDRERPDVVIGDFRLSLFVSCKLARKPYGNIANAYWSPRYFQYASVPDIPLTRLLGPTLADLAFRAAYRPAFAWHARAYAQTARRFGVDPPPGGLQGAYTVSDCTAYADLPALYAAPWDPSPNERFVGPLLWSPNLPVPATVEPLGKSRPLVYVTLGSSGPPAILGRVLGALADLPVDVAVATAGAPVPDPPGNAVVFDYLPGNRLCERATLVIGNGGSPITYQALAAGKPVLGLASNLDQFLNMRAVEAAGFGTCLRASHADSDAIRARCADLIDLGSGPAKPWAGLAGPESSKVVAHVSGWLDRLDLLRVGRPAPGG